MRIPKRDIPQADKLSDVLKVVEDVSGGSVTFQRIANTIGKGERQGRYYRRAAEILGLIDRTGSNLSEVTPLGQEYVNASDPRKRTIALEAVLGTRIFQRIIPFLESKLPNGCRPEDFKNFLESVTEEDTGETMMPRRASTLIGWLRSLGMMTDRQDKYVLSALPNELRAISFVDAAEPLLPSTFQLSEYRDVQRKASENLGIISRIVDETKIERANSSHAMLTNLVATRIRGAGGIPRYNELVDLAAKVEGTSFIFEMKSMTPSNARAQVRRGLSQLYEYRYLQNVPDAKLVLVVENPLTNELAWMTDYLIRDRRILLVWDGDKKHLHCSSDLRSTLGFLVA